MKWPNVKMVVMPAVPVALAVVLAISGCLTPVFCGYGGGWVWFLGWLVAGMILACLFGGRRLAGSFLSGWLLAMMHIWAPWQTYRGYLPRAECGAELRVVIVEPVYAGDELEWLKRPYGLRAVVQGVKVRGRDYWQDCRGTVVLRLPRDCQRVAYGTEMIVDGGFLEPSAGSFPGDFNYRNYLRTQGVFHVFKANVILSSRSVRGWRRGLAGLYSLRDAALERVVSHVVSDRQAGLLAAMSLGYRQGLQAEDKQRFLRSGTIHIFAISGMHTAIVGGLLLLLLTALRVRFCWRYASLPFLLGAYVFMTGAAPSAVRAWVMVSIWAVTKARFRSVSALNTVAVAALFLLVVNPLDLAAVGFQFSFVIVLVLILGWHVATPYVSALNERELWVPYRHRSGNMFSGLRKRGGQAVCASILAWLGSAGLVLRVNALLIPAGLLINILVSLLMSATLTLGFMKLLLSWVPVAGVGEFLGGLLGRLLGVILGLAELGSQGWGSVRVGALGVELVVLYYLCLFGMLLPWQRGGVRLACLGACLSVLLFGGCRRDPMSGPRLIAVQGNDCKPCPLVVFTGAGSEPLVINTGDPVIARSLGNWLAGAGVEQVDGLILTGRCQGLENLLTMIEPRTVWVPRGGRYASSLRKRLDNVVQSGGRIREIGAYPGHDHQGMPNSVAGLVRGVCMSDYGREGELRLDVEGAGDDLTVKYQADDDRGTWVTINSGTGEPVTTLLPLALKISIVTVPYEKEKCEKNEKRDSQLQ